MAERCLTERAGLRRVVEVLSALTKFVEVTVPSSGLTKGKVTLFLGHESAQMAWAAQNSYEEAAFNELGGLIGLCRAVREQSEAAQSVAPAQDEDEIDASGAPHSGIRGVGQASLPPIVDRNELIALLEDLASVNLSREAVERQARRVADDLIARGLTFAAPEPASIAYTAKEPPVPAGFKPVYVKRWRTLILVPVSIADEVRDTLAAAPPPPYASIQPRNNPEDDPPYSVSSTQNATPSGTGGPGPVVADQHAAANTPATSFTSRGSP